MPEGLSDAGALPLSGSQSAQLGDTMGEPEPTVPSGGGITAHNTWQLCWASPDFCWDSLT